MRRAFVLVVAVAALALAACGDDDGAGSSGDSAQTPAGQDGGSDTGGQSGGGSGGEYGSGGSNEGDAGGGEPGASGTGGGSGGGSGEAGGDGDPSLDLDDKAPAPKVGGKDRGKQPDVSGAPKSAGDFSGVARQVFETSRYFCRQTGVEGMRKEYDIKSDDPQDIAREAARRNQPRGFPEAVYSGCLEGLRQAG